MLTTDTPAAALEVLLHADPDNEDLRAELFDVALRSGGQDAAQQQLAWAQRCGRWSAAWRLREAHLWMARRRWDEAARALDELRAQPGAPEALVLAASTDAAQVALVQDRISAGLALLLPWMDERYDSPVDPARQTLWLRLLHRADRLQDAVQWAERLDLGGRLSPRAAGVASLAALDHGDLTACRRWSEAALREPGVAMEALVARASLALAERDTARAQAWLHTALDHRPDDGRARSALGFAELQAGQLDASRASFEQAVHLLSSHIGTWHGLGWVCLLQGDLAAATRAFAAAMALDRNFADNHGALAVVQIRSGLVPQARLSIERAMRLDAHCVSAHYAQALLDGTADDADRLQHLAERLMRARAVQRRAQ